MRTLVAASAAMLALVFHVQTAGAVERDCPKGQIWDVNRGACKKGPSGKGGKVKKYKDGLAHIEGRAKNADPAKGVKLLGEACKAKLPEACTQLGYVYLNGRAEVTKDAKVALEYYDKGCDLKDPDGCIGAYEVNAYGYLGTYDYSKGLPHLKRGCETLKSGRACRRLAQLYDWGGTGVDVNKDEATRLYKLSFPMLEDDCDDGDGASCSELGWMYRDGYGVTFDLTKAVKLFEKGCDNGAGEACYSLAGLYDPDSYYSYVQGREALIDKTYAKPFKLYEKACNNYDHFDSCYTAGRWLADGKVTGDTKDVEKMAKRVCDISPYSCNLWASLKDEGKAGVPLDKAGALALYEKACEASNSTACTTAAEKYSTDYYSGNYNLGKAVKLWEKACELWDPYSCTRAAQWYYYGDSYNGIAQDYGKAFTMFSSGCNRGDYSACSWAGDMLTAGNDGTGIAKPKDAIEYYGYACNYGYGYTCAIIAAMYEDGRATLTGVKDPATAAYYYELGCFGWQGADWTSCSKTVEMRRAGTAEVPKDLVMAGRAQAQICKSGGAVADCLLVDKLLKEGNADEWVRNDVVYTMDSACSLGYYESACVGLALLYRDGGYIVAKNPAESTRRFTESCDLRYNMDACYYLGVAYEKGIGIAKDLDQARLRYQTACSGYIPNTDACVAMARVMGDPRESLEEFKRLCNQQQLAAGCSGAAAAYFTGSAGRWDVSEAYELYAKGCDLNDSAACSSQALMLEHGIGKEANPGKSFELYQKACRAGYAAACGGEARFHESGAGGVTIDLTEAEKLYATACDAEAPDACRWFAAFMEKNKKGTATQIAQLNQRALTLAKEQSESPQGKWLLGTLHRDGVATVKSAEAAVKLFVEACDANFVLGCLDAGRMYMGEPGSEGLKRDLAIAAVNLDKACSASVAVACDLAAKAKSGNVGTVDGAKKGCCDAGGGPGAAVPGILLALLLFRSRRPQRARARR